MTNDLPLLLEAIQSRSTRLDEGETLFHTGDEARAIFLVEQGCLRLIHHGVPGETITVHRAKEGSLFAETALFSSNYPCDAIAERPSLIRVFPKAAVLLHLSAHPHINLLFSAYLARQVQTLRGRLEQTRLKSARERVVAFLTQMGAAEAAIRLDRPLTVVADEIGLTHEALYRTLARLQRDNRLVRPERGLFRLI